MIGYHGLPTTRKQVSMSPLTDKYPSLMKRSMDLSCAFAGLIICSVMLAGLSLLIKVSSPGPVFFRQARVGRDRRQFTILKFRTMHRDAEEVLRNDEALYQQYLDNDFKLPEGQDPRITPVGRWLRRTSLDELPQLFNVLVGDMSMVGPRPVVPEELERYGDSMSYYLAVKPGLTGLWQVCGRSDVDYPQRVDFDKRYVKGWCLLLDLKILALTIPAAIRGNGAH